MATLSTDDIPAAAAGMANNLMFGNDATSSVIVARPGRRNCCALFWFTIPDGFYALVTRHGAHEEYVVDSSTGRKSPVWPCGLHFGPPWLKVSHLVTKQDIVVHATMDGCPTKDNISANIHLSIVLRVMGEDGTTRAGDNPQNVYNFVHELTPMGLQTQLQAALAAAVRTMVRSLDHAQVLGLRRLKCSSQLLVLQGVASTSSSEEEAKSKRGVEYGEEMLAMDALKLRLNQQFTCQGVEILNVVVKEITLPTKIQHQLLQKTLIGSQYDVRVMQHKRQMQSMLHEEEIQSLQQTHELERKKLLKKREYDATMANLKLETLQAENKKNIQSIETQMAIDVELVNVENDLTVQRIADESALETEKIRVQSEAYGEMELAKAESEVSVMLAEGELEAAKNVAKAEKTIRQARSLALSSILEHSDDDNNSNMIALSPRNVMDLGMLLGGERGPLSCARSRRGVRSLPDKRTLDRQRVLTIMAERLGSDRGD